MAEVVVDRTNRTAPEGAELDVLDGLINRAAQLPHDAMDEPLVEGFLRFGLFFLDRCQERLMAGEQIAELFRRVWGLFGGWLGGELYTDDARELEWRACSALELWRRGGDVAQDFELLVALCVLALPLGHQLRDEALSRSMIQNALERARRGHARLDILNSSRSLLQGFTLAWDDVDSLIAEGLAVIAVLDREPDADATQAADDWRFAAASALSHEGQRLAAESLGERASALHQRALEIYLPALTREHRDSDSAVRAVWQWGHFLMNAGEDALAGDTFAAVRLLDRMGSELWWHATYEEGLVRADLDDWVGCSRLLSCIAESLLTNYAAWICFVPEAAELGTARLADDGDASAQREVHEGLATLALAEGAQGQWAQSFLHLETVKALDYRQRAALRRSHQTEGVPPARTAGHSRWMHGVPVIATDDDRARLTTVLARQLQGPTISQVAQALTPDQAVLSLGVAQATCGICITTEDEDEPTGTFLRTDFVETDWFRLLGEVQLGELFRSGGEISSFDAELRGLVAEVDKLIACPIAQLLHERDIRHLTVVPHGWLNLMPIWALPSFSELAVSVAGAASMVIDAPQIADVRRGALVVVDPIGDLPAAHAECAALRIHGLADRLPVRALTGDEATAAGVASAARSAGLLHVAGHATGNAMQPSEAGLVLAAGGGSPKAQIWRAREIEATPDVLASCALAVLSACESGRGGVRVDSISDYTGLPPALLSMGVSSVVATLWRIPDDLGALFADLFYERFAAADTVDVPELVRTTAQGLRTLTGADGAERLTELRDHVSDAVARLRLEAYARRLRRIGVGNPFAGPASWASFYHTGVRHLRLPEALEAS